MVAKLPGRLWRVDPLGFNTSGFGVSPVQDLEDLVASL